MNDFRTRARDNTSTIGGVAISAWCNVFPVSCTNRTWYTTTASAKPIFVGTYESMTDVLVPSFHRKVSEGKVFFNPMIKETVVNSAVAGNGVSVTAKAAACSPPLYSAQKMQWPYFAAYNCQGYTGSVQTSSNGLRVPADIIAGSKINDAIKEVSTKVAADRGAGPGNLYEDIAQYKQALGTYEDTSKAIRDILTKIPRKVIVGASSAYLLYRYGIRPLVEDLWQVKAALEALHFRKRSTTRAQAELNDSSDSVTSYPLWLSGVTDNVGIYKTDLVTVRAMALDEYYTSVSYEAGLGLKNLVTVPWELIPFSFVADWFVNFGDLLKSYAPVCGFDLLGSCVVVERSITSAAYVTSTVSNGVTWVVNGGNSGGFIATKTLRQRSPGLANPGLVWKADNRLLSSLTRAGDALALSAQILLGRK